MPEGCGSDDAARKCLSEGRGSVGAIWRWQSGELIELALFPKGGGDFDAPVQVSYSGPSHANVGGL